jgi:hypothetical protein
MGNPNLGVYEDYCDFHIEHGMCATTRELTALVTGEESLFPYIDVGLAVWQYPRYVIPDALNTSTMFVCWFISGISPENSKRLSDQYHRRRDFLTEVA